jgi:uncharacterized membrane protein
MQPFTQVGDERPEHRGSVCSAHPHEPATSTCIRCGDFLCEMCRTEGESICQSCRARIGGGAFPIDRSSFEVGSVTSYAWSRYTEQWLPLLGASAAMVIGPYAVQALQLFVSAAIVAAGGRATPWLAPVVALIFFIPQMLVSMAFMLGTLGVAFDVLEGRPPSFEAYFGAMKRSMAAVGQLLLCYLGALVAFAPLGGLGFLIMEVFGQEGLMVYMGLAGLVLIVPGIYVGLGLVYITFELAYDRSVGPIEAIRRSFQIVRGKRLDVFLLSLAQAAVMFLGFLACCVGVFPAMGLAFLIQAAGYLALRRGLLDAPPPEPSRF